MSPFILAVNDGSSSLKITIYAVLPVPTNEDLDISLRLYRKSSDHQTHLEEIAHATVTDMTALPAKLKVWHRGKVIEEHVSFTYSTHAKAFKAIMDILFADSDEAPAELDRARIKYICHRIVHGGDLPSGQEISERTMSHLAQVEGLAPSHNTSALELVDICRNGFPTTKNFAYFDTTFHDSIPEARRTYAIDQTIAKRKGLKRYGFHGISYAFITRSVAKRLRIPLHDVNLIICHIGSSASVVAVKGGHSLDTSMGLTPLEGLLGATRSGSVDPSLIFHYTQEASKIRSSQSQSLHITEAEEILNQHAGWRAIAGTAAFTEIDRSGDSKCRLAFDILVDQATGYVGSYYAKLRGQVHALVFAGGIGEGSASFRHAVLDACECLGFEIDVLKNQGTIWQSETIVDIGAQEHRKRVLVCHTDEQLEMAWECAEQSIASHEVIHSGSTQPALMEGYSVQFKS